MPPGELETHSLVCDAMDGINCLWKTRNIYLLVTWHYVVPRSKTLLSEEQLQLARKRDWISLRADIICFVSWTVFLMFRSRKFAYFEEQIIFMDKFTSIYFQAKERLFCLSFFKYYYVKTFYWVRIWPCSVAFFDSIAWTKNCSLLSLVIHKSNKLYHLRSTTRGISGDTFHLFREKTKSCDVLKAVAREQKIFDGWTSS